MRVAVVCPTRERKDEFAAMCLSVRDTSKADVLAYIDDDQDYGADFGDEVKLLAGPRIGRGKSMNVLCDRYRDYDAYLIIPDDVRFTKAGWDDEVAALLESVPGTIGVVNVSRETERDFVNFPCVSRKWIDALGWLNPTRLDRYCQDTALQALGDALGTTLYTDGNCLAHRGLAVEGQPEKIALDAVEFLWFMALEFKECLQKLKAAQ